MGEICERVSQHERHTGFSSLQSMYFIFFFFKHANERLVLVGLIC